MVWWAWWMACSGDGTEDTDTDGDTDTDLPTDTAETGGTTPETGTTDTGVAAGCAEDPALTVTQTSVVDGNTGVQRAVRVTTSTPATVAVRCTLDGDPAEVHLLESPEGTSHELRFSGLLADSAYTCLAAPVCPRSPEPATEVRVSTGPLPPHFRPATVETNPAYEMTGAFTVVNMQDGACVDEDSPWLIGYDPLGKIRWWKQLPAGLTGDVEAIWHPEDDSLVWGGGYDPDGRYHVSPMWGPDTYASENLPGWDIVYFHHDVKRLPDGRALTLELRENHVGLRQWSGWGVRLHDPATGRVDVDLNSQRYVDEGILREGGPALIEPYHANALAWDDHPSGERLYVSQCFDHSILAVEAVSGDVRWKLAQNEGWTVVDAAGAPLSDDWLPQCQHGIEVVGDDTLLLYDNGQDRALSRAVELAVDGPNKRVTVNWSWTDGWFEDTLGDADDLGNGRVLIDQAHPECWSRSPGAHTKILEVDRASGDVVWSLTFSDVDHTSYRAERYGGCELFPGTRFCPATVARAAELAALFRR